MKKLICVQLVAGLMILQGCSSYQVNGVDIPVINEIVGEDKDEYIGDLNILNYNDKSARDSEETEETEDVSIMESFSVGDDFAETILKNNMEMIENEAGEPVRDKDTEAVYFMRSVDLMLTRDLFYEDEEGDMTGLIQTAEKYVGAMVKYHSTAGVFDPDTFSDAGESYRFAAILSKFAGEIVDTKGDLSKEYKDYAQEVFEYAEASYSKDSLLNDGRYWALGELYKLTGNSKYDEDLKEYFKDGDAKPPTGFSKNETGYLGTLAYLTTTNAIDLDLCERMMDSVIDDANSVLDRSRADEYKVDVGTYDEASSERAYSNARLLILADHISQSVEYTRVALDHVYYIYGRNPENISFGETEPEIFILTGLQLLL